MLFLYVRRNISVQKRVKRCANEWGKGEGCDCPESNPPNPQELQLSPELLILINSYSWCQKAMVSSTPDNGNEGNGEGGNEDGGEAPDPAA